MPRLVRKDCEHIAIGQRSHVDQDLAQLVASLALEFEGAVEVVLLDQVAFDEHAPEGDAAEGSVGVRGFGYCGTHNFCS